MHELRRGVSFFCQEELIAAVLSPVKNETPLLVLHLSTLKASGIYFS
jgi:hypothetical protein